MNPVELKDFLVGITLVLWGTNTEKVVFGLERRGLVQEPEDIEVGLVIEGHLMGGQVLPLTFCGDGLEHCREGKIVLGRRP